MKKLEKILEGKPLLSAMVDTLKVYTLFAAVSGGMILAYKGINYLNERGFFDYYNPIAPTLP